jgi:hypothetical protein
MTSVTNIAQDQPSDRAPITSRPMARKSAA